MNLHLLVIDPQNDFCDPAGALFVPGSPQDMRRGADLIRRLGGRISSLTVTLDTHYQLDIAHPLFWRDAGDSPPAPFTIITPEDVATGRFRPVRPEWQERAADYVKKLAESGRYPLCIWPPHCLVGSWGNNIQADLLKAVHGWERDNLAKAGIVTAGENLWTEHYSKIRAEVPDPDDPSTLPNRPLVERLRVADLIAVFGEAKSHCVANTVRDLANLMEPGEIEKIWLIEDCCSNVPGFESFGDDFLRDLTARGMRTSTAASFLA